MKANHNMCYYLQSHKKVVILSDKATKKYGEGLFLKVSVRALGEGADF